MIGIAACPEEQDAVREFFELFKTPWEFYRTGRRYDVLICTQEPFPDNAAELVLFYRAQPTLFDAENGVGVRAGSGDTSFSYDGKRIPIYGQAAAFPVNSFSALTHEKTGEPAGFLIRSKGSIILRVGCDLFQEVRFLLAVGQPPANASRAALELHIALLRDLVTAAGIPLVEIPPIPDGYNFIACLTHDIDHPVLRNHWCDHTMFGFLYRATAGTIVSVCQGRNSFKNLGRNLVAVCTLPFVYLGLARDFWGGFDRYLEMEAGLGATYFVIPRKNDPGRRSGGSGPTRRSSRYEVREIMPQLQRIISSGCELGVHGIDAWLNRTQGQDERDRIFQVSGANEVGVRMHWLFFDDQSPVVLDRAGFAYDSTVGYNETVGYRAGTSQAYRPLGAANLLELPLHIMDTALFYPGYLNLREAEAKQLVWGLIDEVARFGGALTINWHDRSIAPERLWDDFYLELLGTLRRRKAWFPTAARAVSWFRKRRSATLQAIRGENGVMKLMAKINPDRDLPGLKVRIHRPGRGRPWAGMPAEPSSGFVDIGFQEDLDTDVTL